MNQKKRAKLKEILRREFFPTDKPKAIYKDFMTDVSNCTADLWKNPGWNVDVMRIKVVNLKTFSEHNFCWCDENGIINDAEPFKVGDVGYVNFLDSGKEELPKVVLDILAEIIGAKRLDGLSILSLE